MNDTDQSPAAAYTGPSVYDLLRKAGVTDDEITAFEEREREEAAALEAARPNALRTLQRLGLDPDDREAVLTAYVGLRQRYADTLRGKPSPDGAVSPEAYCEVVNAIRSACGFIRWPIDWPAPHLYLRSQPLRNLLPRTKRAEAR